MCHVFIYCVNLYVTLDESNWQNVIFYGYESHVVAFKMLIFYNAFIAKNNMCFAIYNMNNII